MTPKEVLIKARTFIDTPEKWNKYYMFGADGRGADGSVCAVGAIRMAMYGSTRPKTFEPFEDVYLDVINILEHDPAIVAPIRRAPPGYHLISYNGNLKTTHADVVALFDNAIASLPE